MLEKELFLFRGGIKVRENPLSAWSKTSVRLIHCITAVVYNKTLTPVFSFDLRVHNSCRPTPPLILLFLSLAVRALIHVVYASFFSTAQYVPEEWVLNFRNKSDVFKLLKNHGKGNESSWQELKSAAHFERAKKIIMFQFWITIKFSSFFWSSGWRTLKVLLFKWSDTS